jgi:dipeptidyl aminopeptidase/acylaminoacyl peptidase
VYSMNADGSGLRLLAADGQSPSWAPDGRTIAFERNGILLMDAGGGNERMVLPDHVERTASPDLTNLNTVVENNDEPRFSPDGRRIVFARRTVTTTFVCAPVPNCTKKTVRDGDVHVMNVDGGGITRLTSDPAVEEVDAHFSPDGTKIVYFHWPFKQRGDSPELGGQLKVMSADGSGKRTLAAGSNPFWSTVQGGTARPRIVVKGLPRACASRDFIFHFTIKSTASKFTETTMRVTVDGHLNSRDDEAGLRSRVIVRARGMRRGVHRIKIVQTVGTDRVVRTVRFRHC